MKVSRRASAVEPFYAMAIGAQAAALEAAGEHVIALCLGEPDFGAPPAVRAALREVMDGRPLGYSPAAGLPQLRAAIADFYRSRHAVEVDPTRIVVTAGASTALLLAVAATVDPGMDVVMADPSYPCNRQLVDSFGGRTVLVPTTAQTGYQLDVASVARAWTERTAAVMVASPANPTGTSVPPDELAAICALARERGAWRIVDEIYLNLSDPGPDGRPPSVLSADPDAIVVSSFSKYHGMTGWRLGWCVLPEALVPAVERLAMNYLLCASTPAQQAAAMAAFTPESLAVCDERYAELTARRSLVLDALGRIGLPVPVPPDGAFYVYFDVSGTGLDAAEFCDRLLHEAHVALTPGKDFGPATAASHVRLSYTASREDLVEGLRRLELFVAALP